MIESLGGDMGLGEEKDPSAVNIKESDRESENKQQTQSYGNAEHDIRDLLSDDNTYSTDVSDPNYRG